MKYFFDHQGFFIQAKYALILIAGTLISSTGFGQCFDEKVLADIDKTELDSTLSVKQKLTAFSITFLIRPCVSMIPVNIWQI